MIYFFRQKSWRRQSKRAWRCGRSTTPEALLAEIKKQAPKLVIVDLNAQNKPLEAIESVRFIAPDVPLIAFLSHVQADLAQRASAAGSSRVMPRSQFTRELATILAQAKSQS